MNRIADLNNAFLATEVLLRRDPNRDICFSKVRIQPWVCGGSPAQQGIQSRRAF